MSFIFFEAFPALRLKDRAKVLLEDTIVTRVTTPKNHDYLNIYLESDHIITKDIIREVEREIKKQVINNTRTTVRIIETFKLSRKPGIREVYEEYLDSAMIEIEEISIMFFNMMRFADITFEGDETMNVSIPDIPVYHAREQEFSDLLNGIFIDRFGTDGKVNISYHEITIEQKEDEEFNKSIRAITDNERKSEEKFLGASEHEKPAAKEEQKEEKKTAAGSTGAFDGKARGRDGARPSFNRGGYSKKPSPLADDPNYIYGTVAPEDKTIPLGDLNEGMSRVTVRGMIFSVKITPIRDDVKSIIVFNIADFTDAITCRIWVDNSEAAVMQEKLEPGTFVKVIGFLEVSNGKFDRGERIMKPVK